MASSIVSNPANTASIVREWWSNLDGSPITYSAFTKGETYRKNIEIQSNGFPYDITNATAKTMNGSAPDEAVQKNGVWRLSKDVVAENNQQFTDPRDGKVYEYKLMPDGKYWMTENLNYNYSGSLIYNNNAQPLPKVGRLYSYNMARNTMLPPPGWHVATEAEWTALALAAGGSGTYGQQGTAGLNLKSTDGWQTNNNGLDLYGFRGLPAGYRETTPLEGGAEGDFSVAWRNQNTNVRYHAIGTSTNPTSIVYRYLSNNNYLSQFTLSQSSLNNYQSILLEAQYYSVRCVKDSP
ncbi:MAG: hypothetical protein LBC64_08070 [Fibromonadaceae bacterium]|nr:hypothetical protein [Fibromonadaceae bacterium]